MLSTLEKWTISSFYLTMKTIHVFIDNSFIKKITCPYHFQIILNRNPQNY